MRIYNRLFWILIIGFLLSGCSSKLRLLDYWTSDKFDDYSGMNFLVVCKSIDPNNRTLFELEIAKKLRKKGIKAEESHLKYQSYEPVGTEDVINDNKELILASGYNGVILVAVKNAIESYNVIKDTPEQPLVVGDDASLSITYVIEARVFHLNTSEYEPLVGVNLVAATDPQSPNELIKKYSRIVGRHFKDQRRQ